MRIYAAALALEANTFSPLPTSWEAFVEKLHFPPGAHPAEPRHQTGAFWAARERAKGGRFTLVEGSCFAAQPGGPAATAAYERMRDTILAEIKAALPLDGVVLALHGAMVAFGYDDCEGDLLERVRSLVGADCVIGVEFDPHCHLTRRKCAFADIIILFKEYPHTDFVARGEEVVTLVLEAIAGRVKPVLSLYDCRTIASFPTTVEPMRSLVDEIMTLEGKEDILSISIGHGFPSADVPEMGARILVISDGAKASGDILAERIGRRLIALRENAGRPWSRSTRPSTSLSPPRRTARGRRYHRQSRRRRTRRQYRFCPPPDRAAGHRRGRGADLGPDGGALLLRCRCRRSFALRFGGKTMVASGTPVDAESRCWRWMRMASRPSPGRACHSAGPPPSAPVASRSC